MIVFKHQELEEQFYKVDTRLRHIAYALAGYIAQAFSKDLVITSVYRDQERSVHKYWRGLDFRIKPQGGEAIYTDDELEKIDEFCDHYKYDVTRLKIKTLKTHDSGTGFHGHIQVVAGKNTILRS